MPDQTPTLHEILNIPVDAERATGNPAVVYDNRELLNTINQNARYEAENDWRKYVTFQNNLKEIYRNLGDTASLETATQDKEYLQKKAGDVFSEILKDPRSVFSGGNKALEIQKQLQQLRSEATESKMNRIFDFAHREYVNRNPELNTDENKAVIEGYLKQPLGKRQSYMLNLPDVYDPDKLSEQLNKIAKSEAPFSIVSPDNQFIESGTKITYDPTKYDDLAEKMYNYPNERGVPLRNIWERRFNKLPEEIQDQYRKIDPQDPAKAAYLEDIRARRRGPGIEGYTMRTNPNYDSPLDQFKAQTQRIAANAAASRARTYSNLSARKLGDLDKDERQVVGFWNGVVDRIKESGKTDVLYIGDLPEGYQYMSGVNAKGQPIKLQPRVADFGNGKTMQYYIPTYKSSQTGDPLDKTFLSGKYNEYKKAGGKGDYAGYVKNLVKTGVVDLELHGANGTADFNSALQSARALSNKLTSGKEEPVFSETETITEEPAKENSPQN